MDTDTTTRPAGPPRLAAAKPRAHRRPWTDREDTIVIQTYATHNAARQAVLLGRTPGSVSHRREMLIKAGRISSDQRAYRPEWTAEEDTQLRELLRDGLPLRRIAKQMRRTHEALEKRAYVLRLYIRDTRRARTIEEVAQLFGVGGDTVRRVWIRRGWLGAHVDEMKDAEYRRQSRTKPRKTAIRRPRVHIADEHLMAFLEDRRGWPYWKPEWITDREWRVDAELCRAEAGGHWLSCQEVGARYGYSDGMVQGWIRAGALKATRLTNAWFVWSTDLEGWTPPANVGLWAGRKKKKEEAA